MAGVLPLIVCRCRREISLDLADVSSFTVVAGSTTASIGVVVLAPIPAGDSARLKT